MMGAAMPMQEAEVAATARQIASVLAARAQFAEVMARWNALRTSGGAQWLTS